MKNNNTEDMHSRWHDMGGKPAGKLKFSEHDFELWEKRVDALMVLASSKGYFTVDGLRSCLLYTSPSPRDGLLSRMPSSA